MRTLKAITLDLDDSLWAIHPVLRRAEEKMLEHLKANFPRIAERHDAPSVRAMRLRVEEAHPHCAHDFTELRRLTYATLLDDCGYDVDCADGLMDHFMNLRHEVELFEDVLPSLETLAGRYRLLSLSNGNANLARIGIDRFFDGQMNARMAGVGKPDPRIFHAACELLDLDPGDVLHIGDHPVEDVQGARQAGLATAWLNRNGSPWTLDFEPDFTCTSLIELADALAMSKA